MTATTANLFNAHLADTELRQYPVGAGEHIYRGAFVGVDPAGVLKNFVPGDVYVGRAFEEVDNSSGLAAALYCRVYMGGDWEDTLSGAAHTHTGMAVFAVDNATLSLKGHPDAFVGRILHKDADAANKVIVRSKTPFEQPNANDFGCIINETDLYEHFAATGATAGTAILGNGMAIKTIVGPGVTYAAAANGVLNLAFDATEEVAVASLRTGVTAVVSGGLTFEARMHVSDHGDDAALDIDWGIGTALTTDSEKAIDHAHTVNAVLFHMDGSSDNILAWSHAAAGDVSLVDTAIDNVETAADASYKNFKVIIRPSGAGELWVNNVRVLSTTAFAVATAGLCGGYINMEKASNNTTANIKIDRVRFCGAAS